MIERNPLNQELDDLRARVKELEEMIEIHCKSYLQNQWVNCGGIPGYTSLLLYPMIHGTLWMTIGEPRKSYMKLLEKQH